MRQTKILLLASHCTNPCGLCRLPLAPAGRWPFPALSLLIFSRVPGPLPRWLLWCIFPFLPIGHRPSPILQRVGYPHHPHWRLPCGFLSRLQSFLYVQAPRFARHSGRPHNVLNKAAVTSTSGQNTSLLPERCTGYASRPNWEIDGRGL